MGIFINFDFFDLILTSLGPGFSDVLFQNKRKSKGDNSNNFKQLRKQNREGNSKSTFKLHLKLVYGLQKFIDGDIFDTKSTFCHKDASDKYYECYLLLLNLIKAHPKNYKKECSKEIKAKFIEDKLINSYNFSEHYIGTPDEFYLNWLDEQKKTEEKQEYLKWCQQAFRKEYAYSLKKTILNFQGNKTFFKYPLEEFYNSSSQEKIDTIIKQVFGKNYETNEISSTVKKLKYESGIRQWKTFENLFKNELENEDLMELLDTEELLESYQIFQSRMIIAYFLENLKENVKKEIGEDLTNEIFQKLINHVKYYK